MLLEEGDLRERVRGDGVHIVKCVVVGDTAVGKTRLICKRACDTQYSLKSLMTTHVPTVWAIDHYRTDIEVLKRSWCVVDGVTVSLQMWDTFGYHDKDRRFAYGRADVIVICFSAVRPRTLHNVITQWFPEVQHHCPQTPIFLCATQTDLRYLYNTSQFTELDKGPFFRDILDTDIVTPDQGRSVAKEIGAWYYETSVLDGHGITTLFTSVVRGALMYKRDKHFWNILGGLKRINPPLYDPPHQPPKPESPVADASMEPVEMDLLKLWLNPVHYDVVFKVRGIELRAHKACLAVASPRFEDLFSRAANGLISETSDSNTMNSQEFGCQSGFPGRTDISAGCSGRLSQNFAVVSDSPSRHFCDDQLVLLNNEQLEIYNNQTDEPALSQRTIPVRELQNDPLCSVFAGIKKELHQDLYENGHEREVDVITVKSDVPVQVMSDILGFCYHGKCPTYDKESVVLHDVCLVAELLGLSQLALIMKNIIHDESYLNVEVEKITVKRLAARRGQLLLKQNFGADVVFELDDGRVWTHRVLLMAACDVMVSMFSHNFTESSSCLVSFPGVSKNTFQALLLYLYTGEFPSTHDDVVELLMLANRLCLPRLLLLCQSQLVDELKAADKSGRDVADDVMLLLEMSQLHNADVLASWCLWYISVNYSYIYQRHSKLLMSLKPENQVYLSKNRWPPLWFLKEKDFFEKYQIELERKKMRSPAYYASPEDTDPGCLGFCARKNRRIKPPPFYTAPIHA